MLQYKPRVEDRTSVMLRARLRGAGAERDACIVDLSSRGLSATADHPPRRGDFVELVVGDIVLVGQVKWTSMRRFGMAFRERISVVGLMSGEGDGAVRQQATEERAESKHWRDYSAIVRKVEFAAMAAAAAWATLIVADFAGQSLQSPGAARVTIARAG